MAFLKGDTGRWNRRGESFHAASPLVLYTNRILRNEVFPSYKRTLKWNMLT